MKSNQNTKIHTVPEKNSFTRKVPQNFQATLFELASYRRQPRMLKTKISSAHTPLQSTTKKFKPQKFAKNLISNIEFWLTPKKHWHLRITPLSKIRSCLVPSKCIFLRTSKVKNTLASAIFLEVRAKLPSVLNLHL